MLSYSSRTICLIYCLVHALLFILGDAKYWDDWTIFTPPASDILATFTKAGHPWAGHLHLFLRQFGGLGYHLVTFISFMIPPVVMPLILERHGVDRKQAFWVGILMAVLPFTVARVAAINVIYGLCYGLFFMGWFLLMRFAGTHKWHLKFLALIVFFVSFVTQSLLVFYAVPFVSAILLERKYFPWRKCFLRNVDLLILPFIFFALKSLYFSPLGTYSEYYEIHLHTMPFWHSLFLMGTDMLDWPTPAAGLTNIFLICSGLTMVAYGKQSIKETFAFLSGRQSFLPLDVLGLAVFLVALLPYFAIQRFPSFIDWESRYQLLLPLGTALLMVGAAARLQSAHKTALWVLVSVVCFTVWSKAYLDYYVDWVKQQAIVRTLQKNDQLRASYSLLWVDQMLDMNAMQREYRYYDFAGLFNSAYGTQKHFVLPYSNYMRDGGDWKVITNQHSAAMTSAYILKDAKNLPAPALVFVTRQYNTDSENKLRYAVKMLYSQYFRPEVFIQKLDRLLEIRGPVPLPDLTKE
ncbi:MAG: hypothetical protein ACK502_07025 [Alphaproteobacteria bacterium]